MNSSALSPLRPATADLRTFITLSHPGRRGRNGIRAAKIVGVRFVAHRECFVVRAWQSGNKRWDKTERFIPTNVALDFASIDDLVRVGLIVRNADGVWL